MTWRTSPLEDGGRGATAGEPASGLGGAPVAAASGRVAPGSAGGAANGPAFRQPALGPAARAAITNIRGRQRVRRTFTTVSEKRARSGEGDGRSSPLARFSNCPNLAAIRPFGSPLCPPTAGLSSLFSLLLIAVALSACAHLPLSACGSDKDCKLDRVCDAGHCVWAQAPGGPPRVGARAPGVLPLPAYAIEPAQAMFRLGPAHRGRSPYMLPASKPGIWWSYTTGGPITSSPAIADDGSVLFGSHDGKLYVLSRDGTLKWSHTTGDIIFASPAVAHEGTIYIGSDDDHLYALGAKTEKPRWVFQVGACPQRLGVGPEASRCDVDAGPTVGPDGVIYTGGDGVYAINPDGTLRWRFPTNGHVSSAPALLADGTVVAGCQDDLIYGIAPNGSKRWDFRAGGDVESSPSIGDDGTIYVGSDDHKLYALNPDGTLRWAFTTGGDIRASAALGAGIIFIGSFDAQLYAVYTDGTLAWTFRAGDRILSSALVDAKGAVLFGSQDDRLYALEGDGRLRWSVELGGDVDSSPNLAADGTIFVGSDDRKLYALRASAAPSH
jgi:outer membrane protein assembly factor BamB